uniref:Uncharacterized protein n=1 Tax=Trichogramma kaykai TaxID=54128 RepID=A0ABD2W247_9HYME
MTAFESRSSNHTPGHTKSSDESTRGPSSSTSTLSRRHSQPISSSKSTTQIHIRSLISRRPRYRYTTRPAPVRHKSFLSLIRALCSFTLKFK